MHRSLGWTLVVLVASSMLAATASAAVGSVVTNVERTLIDDQRFGACMIQIIGSPSGIDCGEWTSASCTGDFNTPSMGWRKFEVAQIAQVANKQVRVYMDDARKHNGHCFLTRIDLLD